MKIDYKIIGERVRKLRLQYGMTQEKLAEYAEITSVTVSCIERDKKKPSLGSVLKIAFVFGISVEDLVRGIITNIDE